MDELRKLALEMAVESRIEGASYEQILVAAGKFYEFLISHAKVVDTHVKAVTAHDVAEIGAASPE